MFYSVHPLHSHTLKAQKLFYYLTNIQLVTPKVVAIAVNTVITSRRILLQKLRFESFLFPFIIQLGWSGGQLSVYNLLYPNIP